MNDQTGGGNQNPGSFREEGSNGENIDNSELPANSELSPEMGMTGGRPGMGQMSSQMMIYQVHVLGEVRRPGTFRVSP